MAVVKQTLRRMCQRIVNVLEDKLFSQGNATLKVSQELLLSIRFFPNI